MIQYTPKVRQLVIDIRTLTIGEMLALREALQGEFDLPPDIGTREPREPVKPRPSSGAYADEESANAD